MPEIYEGNTGVYCIRNVKNGKRYVGSTAREGFLQRRKDHLKNLDRGVHCNRHLRYAWNKYGSGAFIFQILERCPPDKCIECEQCWIDYFDSANPKKGYNLAPTAGSMLGYKHTEEWKAAASERNHRRYEDPDERHRQSETMKKIAATPENKARRSESMRVRWADPGERQRLSDKLKGKQFSEEHRENLSESMRRVTADPEWRRKNVESKKILAADPDWRQKMAEVWKRNRSNTERNRKISETRKRKAKDPEWQRKYKEAAQRTAANPEWRRKKAEANRRLAQDPEFGRKVSEGKRRAKQLREERLSHEQDT